LSRGSEVLSNGAREGKVLSFGSIIWLGRCRRDRPGSFSSRYLVRPGDIEVWRKALGTIIVAG
jgi:hypothetical protein